jgi:glucoamylase
VVLTGQDGFSPDQARGFQAVPEDFQFGVCTRALHDAGTDPICAVDPGTVPKAMDVFTPTGVSQVTELDPTPAGQPVTLEAVRIP